jgi:hypothetical protein
LPARRQAAEPSAQPLRSDELDLIAGVFGFRNAKELTEFAREHEQRNSST